GIIGEHIEDSECRWAEADCEPGGGRRFVVDELQAAFQEIFYLGFLSWLRFHPHEETDFDHHFSFAFFFFFFAGKLPANAIDRASHFFRSAGVSRKFCGATTNAPIVRPITTKGLPPAFTTCGKNQKSDEIHMAESEDDHAV